MFVALFVFCAFLRVVRCTPAADDSGQWQAHDADAIARAIVGDANDANVDSVLQQEVQSAEHGLLLALAIASGAILIVLAFCVGYWFGLIAKRSAYETTQLMAQRSGASADLRHHSGGAAAQFYGTSHLTSGAYPSIQTLGTAIPAPPFGPRATPSSEQQPMTVLQHRQASAAATTLSDYSSKPSPDRLASLRVERPTKKS